MRVDMPLLAGHLAQRSRLGGRDYSAKPIAAEVCCRSPPARTRGGAMRNRTGRKDALHNRLVA